MEKHSCLNCKYVKVKKIAENKTVNVCTFGLTDCEVDIDREHFCDGWETKKKNKKEK